MVLDGNSSQEVPINAAVPQGPTLAPTLFLLYISDLPDDFIFDIAIYAIVCTPTPWVMWGGEGGEPCFRMFI